ncbi:MAG: WYL domain-containing protein, partial [Actinomycetota bacterium]
MPVTRKSAPKDKNKLIRQLSLVACLMDAPPQGISSREIQRSIEEYEGMSEDTFTRRLHADRDDLRKLGIKIESSRDSDGFSEVNFYRLPPENYFLPEVDFSPGELAALHTCLCLLDGQFAYSRPLRLALQSLSLGTGNPLDDPVTDHVNVNLLTAGFDAGVATSLKRMDSAVLRRKTVVFDYYAISRDEVSTHTVDPYAVMVTRGDWYVVGYSHERDAVSVFKL